MTQTIQQKPTNEIFNMVMGILFIVVGAWFAIGALRGILKEQKQERENITLNSQPAEKSSEEDLVEAVEDTEEGSKTKRIEKRNRNDGRKSRKNCRNQRRNGDSSRKRTG